MEVKGKRLSSIRRFFSQLSSKDKEVETAKSQNATGFDIVSIVDCDPERQGSAEGKAKIEELLEMLENSNGTPLIKKKDRKKFANQIKDYFGFEERGLLYIKDAELLLRVHNEMDKTQKKQVKEFLSKLVTDGTKSLFTQGKPSYEDYTKLFALREIVGDKVIKESGFIKITQGLMRTDTLTKTLGDNHRKPTLLCETLKEIDQYKFSDTIASFQKLLENPAFVEVYTPNSISQQFETLCGALKNIDNFYEYLDFLRQSTADKSILEALNKGDAKSGLEELCKLRKSIVSILNKHLAKDIERLNNTQKDTSLQRSLSTLQEGREYLSTHREVDTTIPETTEQIVQSKLGNKDETTIVDKYDNTLTFEKYGKEVKIIFKSKEDRQEFERAFNAQEDHDLTAAIKDFTKDGSTEGKISSITYGKQNISIDDAKNGIWEVVYKKVKAKWDEKQKEMEQKLKEFNTNTTELDCLSTMMSMEYLPRTQENDGKIETLKEKILANRRELDELLEEQEENTNFTRIFEQRQQAREIIPTSIKIPTHSAVSKNSSETIIVDKCNNTLTLERNGKMVKITFESAKNRQDFENSFSRLKKQKNQSNHSCLTLAIRAFGGSILSMTYGGQDINLEEARKNGMSRAIKTISNKPQSETLAGLTAASKAIGGLVPQQLSVSV